MNILDTILGANNGEAIQQLGSQFGLDPTQTTSAVSALLPAIASGLQRNVTSEGGVQSLLGALTGGGHQQYLDNPSALADPSATSEGNAILGHVLGSPDASRAVASRAAQQTGIGPQILKQMLPLVAAMAMGGLSRQHQAGAALTAGPAGSGLLSMLTPLLDQNRDGSVMDDVLGMAGKMFGQTRSPS